MELMMRLSAGKSRRVASALKKTCDGLGITYVFKASYDKANRTSSRSFRGPGEVMIEVEDNGIGMDEEIRGKLFTAFFSTKGAFGSGLGLLVSHKVAIEHGGSISVLNSVHGASTGPVSLVQIARKPGICALDGAVRSGALELVRAHLRTHAAAADVLECVQALSHDDVAQRIVERLGPPG